MKAQLKKFFESNKSPPSIPTQKFQTVINRRFKKHKYGFGSSNTRFFSKRFNKGPGPGTYYSNHGFRNGERN